MSASLLRYAFLPTYCDVLVIDVTLPSTAEMLLPHVHLHFLLLHRTALCVAYCNSLRRWCRCVLRSLQALSKAPPWPTYDIAHRKSASNAASFSSYTPKKSPIYSPILRSRDCRKKVATRPRHHVSAFCVVMQIARRCRRPHFSPKRLNCLRDSNFLHKNKGLR